MKILQFIYLLIKRFIKKPYFTAILIILPLSCLFLKNIGFDKSLRIKAGILSLGELDINKLLVSDDSVEFIFYPDNESLKKAVSGKDIECGYIFDLPLEYDNERLKKSVICLKSPSTVFDKIVNEVVFSQLFDKYALDILINEGSAYGTDRDKLSAAYYRYLENSKAVVLDYEYITASENSAPSVNPLYYVKGILGIIILLCSFWGGTLRLSDKRALIERVFKLPMRLAAVYSYFFVPSVLCACSVYISLMITGIFSPKEILPLILYAPSAAAYALIVSFIFKGEKVLSAAIAIIMTSCIVFCPIITDITAYIPAAAAMQKLLIPTYYINNTLIIPFFISLGTAFLTLFLTEAIKNR